MQRIIVEGMDNTGKSTLIDGLIQNFHNLTLVVNEKGPEQAFNYWLTDQLYVDHGGLIPIHDRFFYSELVYGKVLRGYINIDGDIHDLVRQQLRDEAFLIYCRPPVDVVRKTLNDRPQMNGVGDNWDQLLLEYDRLMNIEQEYYKNRYATWNWYMDSKSEIVKRVERYLV